MRYHLQLLGRPVLTDNGVPVPITSRKGKALLFYLAAHPGREFPRSHLSALLWSDRSSADARRNFNTMMSRLRHEIPVWPFRSEQDRLGWDPSAGVAVDVAELADRAAPLFDLKTSGGEATHDARVRIGRHRPAAATLSYQSLRQWVDVGQGAFCEGFFCDSEAYDEWLEQERTVWEVRTLTVLAELVAHEAAEERWDRVLAYSRHALLIDCFQESFHRWVMTAHCFNGDRTLAIAHYEELCRTLHRELKAAPDPATTELMRRIKSQPEKPHSSRLRDGEPLAPRGMAPIRPATPLVGRNRVLSSMLRALEPFASRDGTLVLLHGEAGIGKTRLVEEALRSIQSPKGGERSNENFGAVLMGHCTPFGEDLPYAPLVECITRYLGQVDLNVLGLADVWWRHLALLVPDIAARKPEAAPMPVPASERSAYDRLGLLHAVSRFIGALPRPVLIVVEDLHWADHATLEALSFILGPHHVGARPSILASSRVVDFSPKFNETLVALERDGRLVRFALDPLSEPETWELVAQATGGTAPAVAARIHAETGGNPLYVLEVARFLSEGGRLAEEDALTDGHLPVPPRVERVIGGRLSSLAPEAADVLLAASIFPRDTPFSRLLAVSGLAEEDVLRGLEALSASGFLRGDEEAYVTFNHEIVRLAVNKSMSGPRRITLNRRAFAVMAGEAGGMDAGSSVEQLAYHAREGELWEEAVHWYQEAARAAEALFAYSTACRYLEHALECLEKTTAGPERLETELRLRAWRLRLGYWFDPHRDELWRYEPEEELRAATADRLPEVLLAQAETLYMQGETSQAEPLLRRVLELVGESGDPELRGYAQGGIGAVHMIRGDYRQAIEALSQSLTLTEAASRQLPGKSARLARTACYVLTGDFVRAEVEIARLVGADQVRRDTTQAANLHAIEAMLAYLRGKWDGAIAAARLGMQEARAAGHVYNEYYASIWLGAALVETSSADVALQALDRSAKLAEGARTRIMLDWVHAFRGFAHLRSTRLDRAKEAAAEGLRLAEGHGFKLGIALCTEVLGHVAAADGDLETGEELLREAFRLYEATGACPHRDRCRMRLTPELLRRLAPQS